MKAGRLKRLFKQVEHQPFVVRYKQRFPKLANFILNRFDPAHFTGLPLTIVLLVFCVNYILLSQLTESVLESEGIVRVDESFTQLLYEARTNGASEFFYFISYFGSREAVFITGSIVTVLLLYRKQYIAILAFWLIMGGTGLSIQYGKKFVSRDRPAEIAFYAVKNFSFPSGHATTSMSLYGFCAYLLYRQYRSGFAQVTIFSLATSLILSVGFSRIYLGVHYLSDVLAGFILGLLWILAGFCLLEWLHFKVVSKKA